LHAGISPTFQTHQTYKNNPRPKSVLTPRLPYSR
jgi:hypothetical protein